MSAIILANRLKYEAKSLQSNPNLILQKDEDNLRVWYVSFKGEENTLYENEQFKLRFEFLDGYVSKIYFYIIFTFLL